MNVRHLVRRRDHGQVQLAVADAGQQPGRYIFGDAHADFRPAADERLYHRRQQEGGDGRDRPDRERPSNLSADFAHPPAGVVQLGEAYFQCL
jgi:hypothetical protein